jgi:hypothetical protein
MAKRGTHKKGARIHFNGGAHKGKSGTIKKANLVHHNVIFDNGDTGFFIQRSFCTFIESETRTSRLLPFATSAIVTPHLLRNTTDLSDTMLSADASSVESCHESDVDVSSLIGSTHGLACQFLCFYVH